MHWLLPTSAWFGLSILFIIAMYILKKRYTPQAISSTILWQKILKEHEANKPWQRLRQRLLLWIQLLIVLFIVLALMKPAVEVALSTDDQVIVVFDTSYSMYALQNENGQNYWQEAKDELKRLIEKNSNGNQITLIRNGAYPEIIVSRETNQNIVGKQIDELLPYFGTSQDAAATSLARSLAASDEHTKIYYFVDPYYKGISEMQLANESEPSIYEEWHLLGELDSSSYLYLRNFAVQSASNNTVKAFGTIAHSQLANKDITLHVHAVTENNKSNVIRDQQIRLGEQSYTTFTVNGLPEADYYKVVIDDGNQNLVQKDNAQYALDGKESTKSVLLLSDGNLFIEKALQLSNINVIKRSLTGELPQLAEDEISFIIIDGYDEQYDQSKEWSAFLKKYPLFIIDHPNGEEASTYIPKEQKVTVAAHQITNYLLFNDVYISRLKKLSQAELSIGETIVTYGGYPAIVAGYYNQMPMLRFTFSLADSDLPLRSEFPILMLQAFDYMSSGSAQQVGNYMVGETLQVTLSSKTSSAYWKPVETLLNTDKLKTYKADEYIELPAIPGVYQLVEEDASGQIVQSRLTTIQADASDLLPNNINLDWLAQDQLEHSSTQTTQEGWKSLIPLFAFIILLSIIVEWEVYRRGL